MPDPDPKEISIEIAMTEDWQKGDKSVRHGACTILNRVLEALDDKKGLLIGRHGTIELTMILQLLKNNYVDLDRAAILERNAGVFPKLEKPLTRWLTEYTEASMAADVMAAGWYKPLAKAEWNLLKEKNPSCLKIPLRSLEPYYCKPVDHWTRVLEGRRVTVVSSFTGSMEMQMDYRDQIWPGRADSLLPIANWSFVRSYYAPVLANGNAAWPPPIASWIDALVYLEQKVLNTKPEIVLIGCGGLGMILGHRLKQRGIIAIVMGGAIQILFGIKGKRWENHPIISSFITSDWIKPNQTEVPNGASSVEGGCYW